MRWHIPECGVKSQAHPNSKRWAPLSTTDPLRAEGQQGGLWPLPPAPVSKGTERSQGHCSTRVPTVLKAKVKGWSWWMFSPGVQWWESRLPLHPQRTPTPWISPPTQETHTHIILRGPTEDAGLAFYALPLVGLDSLSHVQGELQAGGVTWRKQKWQH